MAVLTRLLLLLFVVAALPAWAAESAAVASPRAIATLVSDTDRVAPNMPFKVGLRLRLAPGWHTYWQNPGDAGVAPDAGIFPPRRRDRRAGGLAGARAPARGAADDLRLQRRGAAGRRR